MLWGGREFGLASELDALSRARCRLSIGAQLCPLERRVGEPGVHLVVVLEPHPVMCGAPIRLGTCRCRRKQCGRVRIQPLSMSGATSAGAPPGLRRAALWASPSLEFRVLPLDPFPLSMRPMKALSGQSLPRHGASHATEVRTSAHRRNDTTVERPDGLAPQTPVPDLAAGPRIKLNARVSLRSRWDSVGLSCRTFIPLVWRLVVTRLSSELLRLAALF